jgi:hypothetical protein
MTDRKEIIMSIKQVPVITVQTKIVCDFCGTEGSRMVWVANCLVCGKDFCAKCPDSDNAQHLRDDGGSICPKCSEDYDFRHDPDEEDESYWPMTVYNIKEKRFSTRDELKGIDNL